MSVTIDQLIPEDIMDALFGANAPMSSNVFATMADLSGFVTGNLYTQNNTVGPGRVATITDTLTWTGGTTIMTYTSGSDTIVSGVGVNPIGFGATGDLNYYTGGGSFDSFTGLFKSGTEPLWQAQIYNNATFVENGQHYVGIANYSGTDRPFAGVSYTSSAGVPIGFEANVNGERLLSQQSGLNFVSPLPGTAGLAFLSGAGGGTGFFGATNQLGFQSWMNAGAIAGGWGGIYEGSGIVPTSTVATVTDTLTFTDASIIIQGVGTDETSDVLRLEKLGGADILKITDDVRFTSRFDGNFDAAVAGRNHVWNMDANILERTGGDGFAAYAFNSTYAGVNTTNWYRTMIIGATTGGTNPASIGGRVALSAGAVFSIGGTDDHGKTIYANVGNSVTRQRAIHAHLVQGLATTENHAIYAQLQPGAQGSKTGPMSAVTGLGGTSDALYTGTIHGGNFLIATGATVASTNIGMEAGAIGASATNMAIRVQANRGVLVFGTTSPVASTMMTMRGLGTTLSTYVARFLKSNGAATLALRDDGLIQYSTTATSLTSSGAVSRIIIADTYTATGFNTTHALETNYNPTGNSTAFIRGTSSAIVKNGANNAGTIIGSQEYVRNNGTGNITTMYGSYGFVWNTANATITNMFGYNAQPQTQGAGATITNFGGLQVTFGQQTTGTITNHYGVLVKTPTNPGATITNTYGLQLQSNTLGTNNWGIHVAGATRENFIEGNFTVGVAASLNSKVEVHNGDIEVVEAGGGRGLILEAPDTTRYRVTVNNAGALVIAAA